MPAPSVKLMLPMTAAVPVVNFKKLPVGFATAIFNGAVVADTDVPVSEFLDVITAVAAALSYNSLDTFIV